MIKSLFLTSSLLIYSSMAFSQGASIDRSKWKDKDFWAEVQLDFQAELTGMISSSICLKTLSQFKGCLHALSEGVTASADDEKIYVAKSSNSPTEEGIVFEALTIKDQADYKEQMRAYSELVNDWYKRITSNSVLARPNFEKIQSRFKKQYVNRKNESYITAMMINGFLNKVIDPHTYLKPRYQYENESKGTTSIGTTKGAFGLTYESLSYQDTNKILVKSVFKGSASMKAGVEKGDIFISVNGKLEFMEMKNEIDKKNTIIVVVLSSRGKRTLTISRELLDVDTVEFSLHRSHGNTPFAYIKLSHFMDPNGCQKVKEAGEKLLSQGAKGMILDLRNNGGGLVNVATCINSLFLEEKSLVFVNQDISTGEFEETENNSPTGPFRNIHTAVLVNGYSASASEIVSIYLQAYRKAFIVGENSFGKGTMQTLRPTKNPLILMGSTIAKYYGPQGISPQLQGVTPDIEALPNFDQKEVTPYERERDLYDNAIANKEERLKPMADRVIQIKQIKECLNNNNAVERAYDQKDEFKKRVHDNQKTVAIEVLHCALDLRIPIFKKLDIPTLLVRKRHDENHPIYPLDDP